VDADVFGVVARSCALILNVASPSARQGTGWFSRSGAVTVYTRPHLSFSQQIDLLKGRGLAIGDRDEAAYLLSVVGCYRLSCLRQRR
jgi:hypothetical protein